jgi:hypothetical protein
MGLDSWITDFLVIAFSLISLVVYTTPLLMLRLFVRRDEKKRSRPVRPFLNKNLGRVKFSFALKDFGAFLGSEVQTDCS